MGFEVHVDTQQKLIISRWQDAVDETALRSYVDEAWTDPSRRGFNELIDFSLVSDVDAPFEALQAVAEYSRQFDNPEKSARTAVVAPSDLIFGLSRMFAGLRSADEDDRRLFAVFGSDKEASHWLSEAPPP